MTTQSEMVLNNESWTRVDSEESQFLNNNNNGVSWPFQGEEMMSEAFLTLLNALPLEIANSKDLSELEILTLAMKYIKKLENDLKE